VSRDAESCIFTGYWPVKNNPKIGVAKVEGGLSVSHIQGVNNKSGPPVNAQLVFCPKRLNSHFPKAKNIFNLELEELPSLPYISKLHNRLSPLPTVLTKYCKEISSPAFLSLASIWTSKALLFSYAKKLFPDSEYFFWVDNVTVRNFHIINESKGKKCFINRYNASLSSPFNGFSVPHITPPDVRHEACRDFWQSEKEPKPFFPILAQAIKIHTDLIDVFEDSYIKSLSHVDEKYFIYDEEIVLTHLFQHQPDLFKIF